MNYGYIVRAGDMVPVFILNDVGGRTFKLYAMKERNMRGLFLGTLCK
jgi:hypothetical protein